MNQDESLSVFSALAGRNLLLTGSTGFIGKVTLALLLDRAQDLGKIHVLVRPRPGQDAAERFFETVNSSPAFDALREQHGNPLSAFLKERVEILPGDVTRPDFGLSPENIKVLSGRIDAIINIAGLVSLNPGLQESLEINAYGALYGAELAVKLHAKLVHMSTCYVAGVRRGEVRENETISGYSPKREATDSHFSAAAELAECRRFIIGLENRAAGEMTAAFREAAARRLADKGRPVSEKTLALGARRQAKRWLEIQMIEEGRNRARKWGWPNIYCYTKALGEQLIAQTRGLDYTIVRPSIVESSLRYPFPGWNEGLTTSAPVILAMCTGHWLWPAHRSAAIDLIPVDLVASATIAAAGAIVAGRHERVYHLASSDRNPLTVRRCIRFVSQYRRAHYRDHAPDALWAHWLWTRPSMLCVPEKVYRRLGVPAFRRAALRIGRLLGEPPKYLGRLERELGQVEHVVDTFLPFIHDIDCVFRTDHVRALYRSLPRAERCAIPWDPERIDWRHYWFEVHTAGLRRFVFPGFPGRNGGPLRPARRPVADRLIRGALSLTHRLLYTKIFTSSVHGTEHIPDAPGFIVASNHASHLDMGLVKLALGPLGARMAALAAKDYFFSNPLIAWFLRRHTDLLPIGRGSGVKDALALASRSLRRGQTLLIFPEATRSTTGRMASFHFTVGYLALRNKCDVLPAYLQGTHRALPKGRVLPRHRRLSAHLGPRLSYAELHAATRHLPLKEASRIAAGMIEDAVRRLEQEALGAGAQREWTDPSR